MIGVWIGILIWIQGWWQIRRRSQVQILIFQLSLLLLLSILSPSVSDMLPLDAAAMALANSMSNSGRNIRNVNDAILGTNPCIVVRGTESLSFYPTPVDGNTQLFIVLHRPTQSTWSNAAITEAAWLIREISATALCSDNNIILILDLPKELCNFLLRRCCSCCFCEGEVEAAKDGHVQAGHVIHWLWPIAPRSPLEGNCLWGGCSSSAWYLVLIDDLFPAIFCVVANFARISPGRWTNIERCVSPSGRKAGNLLNLSTLAARGTLCTTRTGWGWWRYASEIQGGL